MVLELLRRDMEAIDEVLSGDLGIPIVAARGQQVREQGLQDGEPLRRDGTGRTLARSVPIAPFRFGGNRRRLAAVDRADLAQTVGDFAAQVIRLDRNCTAVLAQHPRGELT